MPAATPIPRGPTVLALGSAADLLTEPGCPVCRYTSEAGDRYLAWFALANHADPGVIARLRASLGMCPRHTRALMSQPGAATRLTALYTYVLNTARDQLTGVARPVTRCPACEHEAGTESRALGTLAAGLASGAAIRERYREFGGLCLAHLRTAATARHQRQSRRLAPWLSATLMSDLSAPIPDLRWLAGDHDQDAEARAVLWHALPATAAPGTGICPVCLAAARAEHRHVTRVAAASSRWEEQGHWLLCPAHLGDAAVAAGPVGLLPLLMWQADCHATQRSRRRLPGWPWQRPSSDRAAAGACAICLARDIAGQTALGEIRGRLRGTASPAGEPPATCTRHTLTLAARDPWTAPLTCPPAARRAEQLITDLAAAPSAGGTGAGKAAVWRRAAVFLDGDVFCGCPPRLAEPR